MNQRQAVIQRLRYRLWPYILAWGLCLALEAVGWPRAIRRAGGVTQQGKTLVVVARPTTTTAEAQKPAENANNQLWMAYALLQHALPEPSFTVKHISAEGDPSTIVLAYYCEWTRPERAAEYDKLLLEAKAALIRELNERHSRISLLPNRHCEVRTTAEQSAIEQYNHTRRWFTWVAATLAAALVSSLLYELHRSRQGQSA